MSINTPINKGNYSMETPERESTFEANRALGWENEYSEYRKNWIRYAKDKVVSEYPLLVDIELSTVCNLKCPMCYTITDAFKSKVCKQFMDMKLFHKIIDEIAGKVPAVRLSLRGEPTLHPEFINCIKYCKDNGIGEVSFLTNGSKLTDEYFREIAEAGADWITVSIDGVGKQYEEIRQPLKFEETLSKIKNIKKIKDEMNWKRPVIKIQAIWPSIKQNPSEYYNTFAPYVDLIAFNPLIDFSSNSSDIRYIENFSCPQIYQRLTIGSDGTVLLCANDEECRYIVGDANKESIYELWHGERLNRIRNMHKDNCFTDEDVCAKCYLPRATEDTEHAFINDREIIIRNYVK